MTITTDTTKVIYNCNASTVEFDYTFRILVNADLQVVLYTIATNTETVLTLTTDYTMDGAGDAGGGTVTTVSTYSSAYQIILKLDVDETQETDLQDNDPLPAATVENAWDKLTLLVKQITEQINRAVVQDASQTSQVTFPLQTDNAGLYLVTDGSTVDWGAITSTGTYTGDISKGLDAAKAAVPTNGDLYIATDTEAIYVCWTNGSWEAWNGNVTLTSGASFTIKNSDGDTVATIDEEGNLKIAGTIEQGVTF